MTVEFILLCPERKCHKCIAMEKLVENLVNSFFPEARIVRLHRPEDMALYNTWIVPSLFLNNIPIARGYVPDVDKAIEKIREILGNKNLPENYSFK